MCTTSTDIQKRCLYNNPRTAHSCLPRRFGTTPWHSLSPSCWNQWWWIGRSNVGCRELGASLSLTYGIYVFPRAGSIHVCCTVRHPSGSAPVKINRSSTEQWWSMLASNSDNNNSQCLHQIQTIWYLTLASNSHSTVTALGCIRFLLLV